MDIEKQAVTYWHYKHSTQENTVNPYTVSSRTNETVPYDKNIN